jgi:hypothetical protein
VAEPVAPKQGQAPDGKPALLDSEGRIYMRDTAGNVKRVPAAGFGRAVRREGWEVAGAEDLKPRDDSSWTAFAEGAASGVAELAAEPIKPVLASKDIYDLATAKTPEARQAAIKDRTAAMGGPTGRKALATALNPLDEKEREAYEGRARQRAVDSPIASTLGRIAGEGLPTMAAGPASMARAGATGLAKAAGTYGPRLGYGVAAGTQGGAYTAAEDAYINDIPLTAERLVASAALGAGLGLGVETAFMGIGRLANKAGFGSKGLMESARDATMREFGVQPSPYRKFVRSSDRIVPSAEDLVETIHELKVAPQWFKKVTTPDGIVSRVAAQEGEEGAFQGWRLARQGEKGEHLLASASEGLERSARIQGALDSLVEAKDNLYRMTDAEIASKAALKADFRGSMDHAFKRITDQILKPLEQNVAIDSAAKVGVVRQQMTNLWDRFAADGTVSGAERMRRELDGYVFKKAPGPGTMPSEPSLAANEVLGMARIWEEQIAAGMEKVMSAGAGPGKASALRSDYETFRKQIHSLMFASGQSDNAAIKEMLRTRGLSGYMIGVTSSIGGPEAGIKAFVFSEVGRRTIGAMHHLYAVNAYKLAKALESDVSKGVIGAIKGRRPLRTLATGRIGASFAEPNERPEKAYKRRADELSRAVADPMALAEQLGKALGPSQHATPKLNGMVAVATQRALMFLASKLPPNGLKANPLDPLNPRVTASASDIRKFQTYWETVNDPRSALDALAKGRLTREHVEALKAAYPLLYANIQSQALETIASGKYNLDRSQRAQWDLLLELNGAGEPSVSPTFQKTLAELTPQNAPPVPMGNRPKLGAKQAKEQIDRYKPLSATVEGS